MTGLLTFVQVVGAFLGAWMLVSVATAFVVIPWFRARARANEALAGRDRVADWGSAVTAVQVARIAER